MNTFELSVKNIFSDKIKDFINNKLINKTTFCLFNDRDRKFIINLDEIVFEKIPTIMGNFIRNDPDGITHFEIYMIVCNIITLIKIHIKISGSLNVDQSCVIMYIENEFCFQMVDEIRLTINKYEHIVKEREDKNKEKQYKLFDKYIFKGKKSQSNSKFGRPNPHDNNNNNNINCGF